MKRANYIVFHPDSARQLITVQAMAMVDRRIINKWVGEIHVDSIGNGNEDPYVFNDPWMYSYCHATHLRRNVRKDSYLQVGSKIIFVSGQQAERRILTVDTFFLVGCIQEWINKPFLRLPQAFRNHYKNLMSPFWMRHLRFPFEGSHTTVSHTYEAKLWQEDKSEFSFLPLDENGHRVSIPFDDLPTALATKISGSIWGKYPVLLADEEVNAVLSRIDHGSSTKVLRNITSNIPVITKKGKC
jgi:hypothetical protein